MSPVGPSGSLPECRKSSMYLLNPATAGEDQISDEFAPAAYAANRSEPRCIHDPVGCRVCRPLRLVPPGQPSPLVSPTDLARSLHPSRGRSPLDPSPVELTVVFESGTE